MNEQTISATSGFVNPVEVAFTIGSIVMGAYVYGAYGIALQNPLFRAYMGVFSPIVSQTRK